MSFPEVPLAQALALGRLDAHDQAALLARGEVSPAELTAAAIARAQHFEPTLAALSHRDFERALAHAATLAKPDVDAPMRGVPWLPKDSLRVLGMPTRGGSRSRTSAPAADQHAFAQRCADAGLVALGKSAMPEFGLMGVTEPLLGPVTRNPWALAHSPGGSSGGAGAALAAGVVPLAQGSDGAGSIRIPASACGVVGLKPGRGTTVRVRSRHPIEDLIVADSLMSRSVRDTAWAFAALHPQQPAPVTVPLSRALRIGVVSDTLQGVAPEPQVAAALAQAVALCEALGHRVEVATLPLPGAQVFDAGMTLWSHLGADALELAEVAFGADGARAALEPFTVGLSDWNRAHCGFAELERAYAVLAALPGAFNTFHAQYDVLLTPTLRTPSPRIGTFAPDGDFATVFAGMFDWMGYTPLQNLAGTPAISLPLVHGADGPPIGVQFAADRGQEPLLLALALQLESAAPWRDRWPPVSVAASEPCKEPR
ncbi:amidase [Pseudoxanthomonas sp. GM95]|uniref:amidase family protein n=1 Tax=Pseudoxanthomonas sp. GM95 TaxID=1881043 RepID=UPI0008D8CB78|nr:amidase family protein [Pseudoxanthomonas sp. GM95]SEM22818.1 amidase [Pseudoxanthomonas sp. GM95]